MKRFKRTAGYVLSGLVFGILAVSDLYGQGEIKVVSGYAQGTTYQVKYVDPEGRGFRRQIDSLLNDFDESLSLYREDSELSLFNRSHAVRFVKPYFYPVLLKSEEVYRATGGLFDPTVMPLVEAYGFGPGGKRGLAGSFDLDSVMQLVGFDKISFDQESVRKSREEIRLDFNAIAQGYSADVIGTYLESHGVVNYLIEVGGELKASGVKPDKKDWVVGISDPTNAADLLATVKIRNRGMATSGNYRNHYTKDGVTYTHIVDPVTGHPGTSDILSVTVFAADAMTADAYATAFLLMGAEALKSRLNDFPSVDVFLVYVGSGGEKRVFTSEGILSMVQLK